MTRRFWTGALLLAAALWLVPLGSYRLFNPDEGRYAEIPREMLVSGDWVTPRLDGLKYFEKPPLQYWATAVAFRVFGENEWSARLFSALSSLIGLMLTAWVGTRLFGARVGAIAALVQAGALLYLGLTRITTLDMGLSVTLELALVGLLLLVNRDGATLPDGNSSDARLGAALLAVGVALAFLSKGLVGILIPGAVGGWYLLWQCARWRWNWGRTGQWILNARPWWTLAALGVCAAPWVWMVEQRNPGFAQFFFVHEHFARFLTRVHQRYEPVWFFVPVLLLGFMPWTSLLPGIAQRAWREVLNGHGATTLLVIWVLFGLVFFSISQSKLVPYILPLFPALCLLAAQTISDMEPRRLARLLAVSATLWLVLTVIVLSLWLNPAMAARLEIDSSIVAPVLAAGFMLAAVFTAVASWLAARRGALGAVAAAAIGSIALMCLAPLAADQLPRQRSLAGLVESARTHLHANTTFYCVGDYEQSIPFYLRRTCILVGYRGELDFGLQQEPTRALADLTQFATQWRAQSDALAVIRTGSYEQLRRMGLPMRVIYTAPSLIAVVKE